MSRRRKGSMQAFMAFCAGVVVLTMFAVILVAIYLKPQEHVQSPHQTQLSGSTTQIETPEEEEITAQSGRRENFFTLLLAGTDMDGTRTDTIMVAAIDTADGSIKVLSIPRDTYSYKANGEIHRINAAHNKGIDRMLTEIEATIGFAPDRYCIIDYQVFVDAVNIMGGVDVDVPIDMQYEDPDQDLVINIPAGYQHLDGERALHYMRFRSGYANQDLGRIEAQQRLLSALADQAMTPSTLLALPKLVTLVTQGVETDLSGGEIVWLGTKLLGLSEADIDTWTLPGEPSGAAYAADEEAVLELINEHFNPYHEPITELDIPD